MSTVENLTQHLPCGHTIFVSNSVVNKNLDFISSYNNLDKIMLN